MPVEEVKLNEAVSNLEKSIKKRMIERNFTQIELAKMIGVGRSSVSTAISGGSSPKSKMIRKKLYKILEMED